LCENCNIIERVDHEGFKSANGGTNGVMSLLMSFACLKITFKFSKVDMPVFGYGG